jgi:ribosomal protein S18 acetylase RimI-like enzyme
MTDHTPDPHIKTCIRNDADIDAIADVMAKGFADDPVMNWALGSPKPQKLMFALLARHIYLPRGGGSLLRENGENKAACLWLNPGQSKDFALFPTLRLTASVVRHSGPSAIRRTLDLDKRLERLHPPHPHVYLFAIAADPRFQGQGLGKRVMAPMLRYCDEHSLPAYLENSKAQNLGFYRGRGFEVVADFDVNGQGLPMWLMQRKPQ